MQQASEWLATRFGTVPALGYTALAIETLRIGATETDGMQAAIALTGGGAAVILVASVDWHRLTMLRSIGSGELAVLQAAIEPNLILVATSVRLTPGQKVKVHARHTGNGVVVGNLAGRGGNTASIALDGGWASVYTAPGESCRIEVIANGDPVLALAVEGSTHSTASLLPVGPLALGDTLAWGGGRGSHLYQVTALALERQHWDASNVLSATAQATLLGTLDDSGDLSVSPVLPHPHASLRSAGDMTAPLSERFTRIGVIAGTKIEFGVDPQQLGSHHAAILGMSGMGKTTVARRLLAVLEASATVIALDGTGEYRTRFGLTTWDPASATSPARGAWVHEPPGEPPQQAMLFIKTVMTAAHEEYLTGTAAPRSVLFEEAHSFLPEWNFTAYKGASDHVATSCRFILQARKFGINFIFVSQRTAVISKSALSQCESYVILRTLDGTSLDYIEGVVGRDMRQAVPSLRRFQALCVGPAFSVSGAVIVDLDA